MTIKYLNFRSSSPLPTRVCALQLQNTRQHYLHVQASIQDSLCCSSMTWTAFALLLLKGSARAPCSQLRDSAPARARPAPRSGTRPQPVLALLPAQGLGPGPGPS
eukprot:g29987.t1